jgi:hypothetical protein
MDDDLPVDFTEYLCQQLGLPEVETKRLLVAWLTSYEPQTRRPIHTLARTRVATEWEEETQFRRAG